MSVHIIIDGYNLIRQSSQWSRLDLRDMQLGREALLSALAEYKKKKAHRITVVFDAAHAPVIMDRRDKVRGISVIFSEPGQSADAVIKRMSAQLGEKALVVSSDREVAGYAAGQGAAVIDSPDFEMRLSMALYGESPEEEEETGWKPTTRKKGPGRRLPKRQRRNQSKLRKL